MRYLILADRHEKLCSRLAINHDVGALQNGIAEETVVVQVLVLDAFQRFFVRGIALQPAECRHHGQQQMQLRVFRNDRLLENYALCRIESRRQVIDHDLQRVLRNRGRVRVIARQRMPIRDEVKAVIRRIIL